MKPVLLPSLLAALIPFGANGDHPSVAQIGLEVVIMTPDDRVHSHIACNSGMAGPIMIAHP